MTERELALSTTELIDAASGAIVAAVIVFYGLPRLLYRERYLLFAVFCLVGVGAFGTFTEAVMDPLVLPADDPRVRVSRWGYLNVLASSFAIAAIVAMFDNVDYQRRLRQLGELRSQAELAALRHQLNPHIVLNTLNNLYSLSLDGDRRTPEMVLRLARILRYSLYEAEDASAPLESEVELLDSYIALQEVGLGDRAEISFMQQGRIAGRRIAPLLLLPLVENAFKHGSAVARDGPIPLRFTLQVEEDAITFETANPFDAAASTAGAGGIGLDNLRDRLRLTYPDRHQLHIDDAGGVYRVTLVLRGNPA